MRLSALILVSLLSSWHLTTASYYGEELQGNLTASGEVFDAYGFTAAHPSYPFGTMLRVCYLDCVNVRVTDRGPSPWTGHGIDLSAAAADAIGLTYAGVGVVSVEEL